MNRALLMACLCALPAAADEGMWLYQHFPTETVKQEHGFAVTKEFLDNLRLATVRIAGGSGAFVSPNGLLVTNRHLVAGCAGGRGEQRNSANNFFYAASQAEEARCTGVDAAVLTEIEDVTQRVKAAAKEGAPAAKALEARKAEIAHIESECAGDGRSCAVVALYSGERYDLYRYKKYSDVRLVFAPEQALAFFGRERDSITYLRYGLDIAFLRAYEEGKPAATPHYLKWSAEGVKDGDLVFASGNPATTVRETTAAQLTFYRDTALPVTVARLGPRLKELMTYAAKNEREQRAAEPVLSALLEAYKSSAGKLIGLRDDRLVLRKTSFDQKIRHAVEGDPKLGTTAGKVWDQVAAAYKAWTPFEKPYQILEGSPAPGSNLFNAARRLVRASEESDAGSGERDFSGRVDDSIETMMLAEYLEELKNLKKEAPPMKSILEGKTPQQAAEALVQASRLKDPAERRRLAQSHEAVEQSEDGMIRLALELEEPARRLAKKRAELIGSLEASAAEKIAQYRYQLFGDAEYPDATATPRVEFGVVKGYTDRAGVLQPFAATFGGLFYREDNKIPYLVPQRWLDSRANLALSDPLDFVSTCDIGGGESGSPTVNRAGELVGVIFDGNLESLPNTYLYTSDQARAVHVSVEGIAESLEKVYKTAALLRELGLENH